MKALITFIFAMLVTPVLALNLNQPISNLDGTTVVEGGKSMIAAGIIENALLLSFPDEQNLAGDEKIKRYALALKINAKPEDVQLTADEIALIKKLVAKGWGPLIVGQIWKLLDPASVK